MLKIIIDANLTKLHVSFHKKQDRRRNRRVAARKKIREKYWKKVPDDRFFFVKDSLVVHPNTYEKVKKLLDERKLLDEPGAPVYSKKIQMSLVDFSCFPTNDRFFSFNDFFIRSNFFAPIRKNAKNSLLFCT